MRSRGTVIGLSLLVMSVLTDPAWAAPGDLDPTFGNGGLAKVFGVGNYRFEDAADLEIQADGKIVVAGTAEGFSGGWAFALVRLNPDGVPDSSFGKGGRVVTELGDVGFAYGVALEPDGKIVVAGKSPCSPGECFTLVRYQSDGRRDQSFGHRGITKTEFGFCGCFAFDVATAPDGKIVAAGYWNHGSGSDDDDHMAVARYNLDGSLDSTFGNGGKAIVEFGFGDELGLAVTVQPDGKTVIGGEAFGTSSGSEFGLARLDINGNLDSTFSEDGLVATSFGAGRWDVALDVSLDPAGNVLAAGASYSDGVADDPRVAVARYGPDGSLDPTFGNGGLVLFKPGQYGGIAQGVVEDASGRVVVSGEAENAFPFDRYWMLARLMPDGTPDRTFSSDGLVIQTWTGGDDYATRVRVQTDGKIVVAGQVSALYSVARFLA